VDLGELPGVLVAELSELSVVVKMSVTPRSRRIFSFSRK
jgi:hypothetical protein